MNKKGSEDPLWKTFNPKCFKTTNFDRFPWISSRNECSKFPCQISNSDTIMQCFDCMFRIILVLKMRCSCHVWTKMKNVYRRIGNGNAFCWEVKVCWYFVVKYVKWAIPFNNIPCRGYMFLIVILLRNSKLKTLYPWRIPSCDKFQA